MTLTEVAQAVVAWASGATGITSTYLYAPSGKPEALPDLVVEFQAVRVADSDARFPYMSRIQQRSLMIYELMASIMVSNVDEAGAAETLRGYADVLQESILSDITLGSRVTFASPYVEFGFTPPFAIYADGTMGREMTMNIAVADFVEVR